MRPRRPAVPKSSIVWCVNECECVLAIVNLKDICLLLMGRTDRVVQEEDPTCVSIQMPLFKIVPLQPGEALPI